MVRACRVLCALGLALLLAAAGAAPFNETSLPGGDFSDDRFAPTPIGPGFDRVTGNVDGAEAFDFFVFTGLPAGVQELTFVIAPFLPVAPDDFGFNASGALRVSLVPFQFSDFDGQIVGTPVGLNINNLEETRSFTTPADFMGDLFFSFNYTGGTNIGFEATVPSNAAPIPLPASALLFLGGLAALGVARRARG